MNKIALIIIGGTIAVLALLGIAGVSISNSIVTLEEKVDSSFSDIDVQLQRRADLVPNLVSAVKGYMSHEEKIIKDITDARERMVNASSVAEKDAANSQLSSALQSLNVVVENYPDLKSSQNFINLQDELAGTENRISVARKDYNDAVKAYNTKIKTFPASIIAGMQNKEKKEYFGLSDESKKDVPTVDFNE
jgi:LemA protein